MFASQGIAIGMLNSFKHSRCFFAHQPPSVVMIKSGIICEFINVTIEDEKDKEFSQKRIEL